MSSILSGLIQAQLKSAFPTNDFVNNKQFADAMAKAIQAYLNGSVQTVPAQSDPGSGPVTHIHPVKPIKLKAN